MGWISFNERAGVLAWHPVRRQVQGTSLIGADLRLDACLRGKNERRYASSQSTTPNNTCTWPSRMMAGRLISLSGDQGGSPGALPTLSSRVYSAVTPGVAMSSAGLISHRSKKHLPALFIGTTCSSRMATKCANTTITCNPTCTQCAYSCVGNAALAHAERLLQGGAVGRTVGRYGDDLVGVSST